jgi:2,4-dichlorophenol 6-monooxygenase
MDSENVPVLIVGGGGAGLTASLLLSSLGVESLLVSRFEGTSNLPKAHLLSQRTMEIFTDAGVADAVYDRSAPNDTIAKIAWYSGFAGPQDDRSRLVVSTDAWGAGNTDPDYLGASGCTATNLPQIRLEPILRQHAETRPEASVRFGHELVGLDQNGDGVTATVVDHATSRRYRVRADYVLGADGGRTVGDLAGINTQVLNRWRKLVSLHVSADLSRYLDTDAVIYWVFNPEFPARLDFGSAMVPIGPDHWGRRSEEWMMATSFPVDDPDRASPEQLAGWIGEGLGIPGFQPKIHRVSAWWMETALADAYRAGRVFVLGDAAHRHPPTGGLGLNSAIHDAYNLCWKIAAVLAGRAGDELLDTYQAERRPVGSANVASTGAAAVNLNKLAPALGLSPGKSTEENWAALRLFWEDLPGSAEQRHAFDQVLGEQTAEFRPHGADLGYVYRSTAVVDDGSPAPTPVDPVRLYEPSARPGHVLPHAWVLRAGERVALRSLTHGGHFALIAGEDGHDWVAAAEKLAAKHGIPLKVARVGLSGVDLVDVRLAWLKSRGITATGAVLVRPDGHVAFRSADAVTDPSAVLAGVFGQVLATAVD